MIAAGKHHKVGARRIGERIRDVASELYDFSGSPKTAGAEGPIRSAHMRCSNPAAPEETTEANRIIVPNDRGQLLADPDFRRLKLYRRCPSN
jgi:hypothetical protein